jgi:cobalt/nickel transport system permease protein
MNVSVNKLEREARKNSVIHNLDARIKLIMTLIIIVYSVLTSNILILLLLETYVIILILFSKLSLTYYFKRVLLILPFGGFIAVFQPFIHPSTIFYTLYL